MSKKIKIKWTFTDWTIEILSLIGLVIILLSLLTYFKPVDKIPVHYNIAGEIDAWAGKGGLCSLPAVSLGIYLFITFIQIFIPLDKCNYPVKVTPENCMTLYRLTLRLMRVMKLFVVLFFDYAVVVTVGSFWGINWNMNIPIILIGLIFLALSPLYYILKMVKL